MERETTETRAPTRRTPCVVWLPADTRPPAHLLASLDRQGLDVQVFTHRYAAIAEVAALARSAGPLGRATPVAVVLVEPDRLVGVEAFRDALDRTGLAIARWRFDAGRRPAFARDDREHESPPEPQPQPEPAPRQMSRPAGRSPVQPNEGGGWLRLVHDDEPASEPPVQPDPPANRTSSPTTTNEHGALFPQHPPPGGNGTMGKGQANEPVPTTPNTAREGDDGEAGGRVSLTDAELEMLLADDDEFQRLERRARQGQNPGAGGSGREDRPVR